jgi:hypothetical protein
MNEDTQNKLLAAIAACAIKAEKAGTDARDALQYTQAALNAANAWVTLRRETKG